MRYNNVKKEILMIINSKGGLALYKIADEIHCGITVLKKWLDSSKETDPEITEKIFEKLDFFKELIDTDKNKNNILIIKKILSLVIPITLIIFFIVWLSYYNSPRIEIFYPKNNSIIDSKNLKTTQAGDLYIMVELHQKNLPRKKYVSLFAKISGGDLYWCSGNSISTDLIHKKDYINYVTLGRLNDKNSKYEMIAVVKDQPTMPGTVVRELNDYYIFSNTIYLTVIKK